LHAFGCTSKHSDLRRESLLLYLTGRKSHCVSQFLYWNVTLFTLWASWLYACLLSS
jgi:hypothetical protein